MAQATVPVPVYSKHDIHKFCDIHPKLTKENWMSWKREMLAMVRDRGLYNITTGMDKLPDGANRTITVTTAGVSMVGNTPLLQLQEEWDDRNNAAYSQIPLCISPELQISLDHMDQSAEAWNIVFSRKSSNQKIQAK